jgi:transposase
MEISYWEIYKMNPVKARTKMIELYLKLNNISQVARIMKTSRRIVRKWIKRYKESGLDGLVDRPRRPLNSPRRTPLEIEEKVLELRRKTNYGRKRLAFYLRKEYGLEISPNTIRHILRRNGVKGKRRPRKVFYPAHWVWEEEEPFVLAQVDTKDIFDKRTLGTRLWNHAVKLGIPRYQWTFLEGVSRFRLLAYSRELNLSNGLAFMVLVMLWLRRYGISREVMWQTDWGVEFGGTNPRAIERLDSGYRVMGARLVRYPRGRKGYNGRVERSHGIDDQEFYIPWLGSIHGEVELLERAQAWQYVYNVRRAHFGVGMEGKTPLEKLRSLGYNLPVRFAMFPVVNLDTISTDLITSLGGTDVLAKYTFVGCW